MMPTTVSQERAPKCEAERDKGETFEPVAMRSQENTQKKSPGPFQRPVGRGGDRSFVEPRFNVQVNPASRTLSQKAGHSVTLTVAGKTQGTATYRCLVDSARRPPALRRSDRLLHEILALSCFEIQGG